LSPLKIVSPITSYDELGPDKSKVDKSKVAVKVGSSNLTVASIKRVKILRKFWGDEVEEDFNTDSTMEHGTDTEKHMDSLQRHTNAQNYLDTQTFLASYIKSGRKLKNHKSPKNQAGNISDRITTRSKKQNIPIVNP